MTPQSTFMITAQITPDKLDQLTELLATMNSSPGFANSHNDFIPFWQFQNLHVARFVILSANTNNDIAAYGLPPGHWPETLCFIGDIDGDSELFLAEMVIRAEPGLRLIFSHCENFDSVESNLLAWMKQHGHRPAANYVNWQGRTVVKIKQEQVLHQALTEELHSNALRYSQMSARDSWRELTHFVNSQLAVRRLKLTPDTPTTLTLHLTNLLHLLALPLLALVLLPPMVLASPFYFYKLRQLERTDPENSNRAAAVHIQSLTVQEDIDVTNHFNVFGLIKPGRLRLITIRAGLLLLNYASRHIYKRGYLTRIQTIHFARWVLLDDNTRVYFASNYDGSADSYMDDFINKVAWGLNLVFSNGVGYPRTRWLIKGGAEHEEKYKRTLRRNQLPSECWYRACPGLTTVDMARNSRIRDFLDQSNPNDQQIGEWLSWL